MDFLTLLKAASRFHSDFFASRFSTDLRHGGSRNGPCYRTEQGVSLVSEAFLWHLASFYTVHAKHQSFQMVCETYGIC